MEQKTKDIPFSIQETMRQKPIYSIPFSIQEAKAMEEKTKDIPFSTQEARAMEQKTKTCC